jgi:hypothetical protein
MLDCKTRLQSLFADDLQSYNRYSYLANNPLLGTDPSGYFLGSIFKGIKKALRGVAKAVKRTVKAVFKLPLVKTAISIYVGYQLGITDGGLFGAGHAIANGAAGGFAQGLVGSGGDLKAALSGAFSGGAFGFVGDLGLSGIGQSLAHGVAGGLSGIVSGGDFRSGFLSSGFAEFAGSHLPSMGMVGNLVGRMAVGGTTSLLGGGKFGNGATTAAFGYLYNCMQHPAGCGGPSREATKLNKWAISQIGSDDWSWWRASDHIRMFANKCNEFCYDMAANAGINIPLINGHPPTTKDWMANKVQNWVRVDAPQIGDFAVYDGHMGVVTGNVNGQDATISNSSILNRVIRNDWGFRTGQNPTFFRYQPR